MAQQLVSELPNQRTHAMLAVTKMLHFIKLCGWSRRIIALSSRVATRAYLQWVCGSLAKRRSEE
jgi:hypothetical protein